MYPSTGDVSLSGEDSGMDDTRKTKAQLIEELSVLRRRVQQLEHAGEERKDAEDALRDTLSGSRQRPPEVWKLLEGTRAVLEYHDFEEAAQRLFDSCKELTGACAGYVALLTKEGSENEVLFLDSGGLPCTVDRSLPMPIRGLRAEAYRTGRVVYDNEFSNAKWVEFLPEGHLVLDNVMFAPLSIAGRTVGLLGLANKPGGFTEDDVRIAEVFGELAAIALRNSRTLESLEHSEERFRSVVETATDAIISADSTGTICFWNTAAENIFGYTADEVIGKPLTVMMPERFHEDHRNGLHRLVSTGVAKLIGKTVQVTGLRKNGTEVPVELSLATSRTEEGRFFTALCHDITERKQTEEYRRVSQRFLEIANRHSEMGPLLEAFVAEIKGFTGCEAVGVRVLDEHGNIPYQAYDGFSRGFYDLESPLSVAADACMCINVITGETDPRLPFYTKAGSFFMNGTTRFLATVSEEEKGRTRNVCNEMGYESVALVPIRLGDRIIGLIHVADPGDEMVLIEKVETLEGIALKLGVAIERTRAEEELRQHRDHLEELVEERTTELERSRQQLRELAARLRDAREEERIRVAREIHDELGQVLTALKMDLASVEKRLSEMKDHELQDVLLDKVRSMADISDRTIQSVRRISAELRPPVLDHFGLLAAIEWHADEFQRRTGIECTVSATDEKSDFDEATSTGLFRILQEALTNVARHAQAGKVAVRLKNDGCNLVLTVKDNGNGIAEEEMSDSSSLGLLGMRERAVALGGELRICGVPGKGTTVEALIPSDSLDEG